MKTWTYTKTSGPDHQGIIVLELTDELRELLEASKNLESDRHSLTNIQRIINAHNAWEKIK